MAFIRALAQISRDTTDPADVITNTFHFDSDSGDAADVAPEIHAELTAFYQAVDVYMAADLIDNTMTVDYYDLEDPQPRAPVYTSTIALTPTAGAALPPEVSLCISIQGAGGSGVNMRRRRGRIYLGPLLASVANTSGGRVSPASATRTAIATAANNLRAITGTFGTTWAVFSPTTYAETSSYDTAFEDVVGGWVDSEFDIQRRRGTVAQARTLFP